jgi:cupin 2 domain-containing protein
MIFPANLFADTVPVLPAEAVATLAEAGSVRIERIVSHGHASPAGFWYDQERHEWVAVLRGAGRLAFEDGATVELGPGDWVNIPAHRKHRVDWTTPAEPTVWLAVHYG